LHASCGEKAPPSSPAGPGDNRAQDASRRVTTTFWQAFGLQRTYLSGPALSCSTMALTEESKHAEFVLLENELAAPPATTHPSRPGFGRPTWLKSELTSEDRSLYFTTRDFYFLLGRTLP